MQKEPSTKFIIVPRCNDEFFHSERKYLFRPAKICRSRTSKYISRVFSSSSAMPMDFIIHRQNIFLALQIDRLISGNDKFPLFDKSNRNDFMCLTQNSSQRRTRNFHLNRGGFLVESFEVVKSNRLQMVESKDDRRTFRRAKRNKT